MAMADGPLFSRIDGVESTTLDAGDRGLAYGDGLFETIRLQGARAPLLEWHLRRLAEGCRRLALPFPEPLLRDEVREAMAWSAQASPGDAILKLTLTRGRAGRGYRPPVEVPGCRILQVFPFTPRPALQAGIRVRWCETPMPLSPALAGLKHLCRLEQVLAQAEWLDPAIPEGLMCDPEGRLVCGTFTNVFLRLQGRWHTPSLQRAGVAGVMRQWLLEQGFPALGMTVVEQDLPREVLAEADEVFVCNSVQGIWPVVACHDRAWAVGEETHRLQSHLSQSVGF